MNNEDAENIAADEARAIVSAMDDTINYVVRFTGDPEQVYLEIVKLRDFILRMKACEKKRQ